jgi:hypothetical protein
LQTSAFKDSPRPNWGSNTPSASLSVKSEDSRGFLATDFTGQAGAQIGFLHWAEVSKSREARTEFDSLTVLIGNCRILRCQIANYGRQPAKPEVAALATVWPGGACPDRPVRIKSASSRTAPLPPEHRKSRARRIRICVQIRCGRKPIEVSSDYCTIRYGMAIAREGPDIPMEELPLPGPFYMITAGWGFVTLNSLGSSS